jgi:SprT protein
VQSNDVLLKEAAARAFDALSESFGSWKLDPKALRARVEFSPRLRTSLGVCYPEQRLIRLHPILAQPRHTELLEEVVCHEAAHIAAEIKAGKRVRPHGPEWKALVRQCGYEPKRGIRVPGYEPIKQTPPSSVYEHRCPVCHTVRRSSHPQPRWKCADCSEAGLSGDLVITSRPKSHRNGTSGHE